MNNYFTLISVLFGVFGAQAALSSEYMDSRHFELLKNLVEINTGTGNAAGLEMARQVLMSEFKQLGMEMTTYQLPEGHKLISFEAKNAKPDILLVGHLDTVFRADSAFQKMTVSGSKIIGPGIVDMKGGIVLIVNILRELKDTQILPRLRVIINDDEETGSAFSKQKMQDIARDMRYGLVFEPGLPGGAVVTSQAGVRWFRLSVLGKAAHAGLEPELGINACVELSYKVARLATLTDFSRHLTLNSGIIEGGTKPNVVCEKASTLLDVRFNSDTDLRWITGQIEAIKDEMVVWNPILSLGPTATLELIAQMPLLEENSTKSTFEIYKSAALSIGQTPKGEHVGYTSDANHLASSGIQLLVGLGPYGGGMHTESEFMEISSYQSRLNLNLALIRLLSATHKGTEHE